MKSKLINDGPQKTYVLVLDKGDEAVGSIEGFAREHRIGAAQLTGIGAFSDAVLGFFDWEMKDYRRIPVNEQVEVVSLLVPLHSDFDRLTVPWVQCGQVGTINQDSDTPGHPRPP
jgi:predicted DNA-binding protein with PD1-like motif